MTMLTDDDLAGMRATSAAALPAVCTITSEVGNGAINTTTGLYASATPTVVHAGLACRVRPQSAGKDDQVGGLHETLGRYVGTVPFDAAGIEVDMMLTVTTGTDSELVGRPLRIVDVSWSEWRIDRRLVLEDLEQPRAV